MEHIKTLQEAIIHFQDFENCRKLMIELRWPDGKIACPHCGSEKVTYLAKPRVWKCYSGHPKPTFSLKTGTLFEESPLGLDKWLPALWLIVNCKNGISSCELAKDLGVTQKTAWFMAHRLRFAFRSFPCAFSFYNCVAAPLQILGGTQGICHNSLLERV
jgi:transposase-like protein